jgi:hypothetical protein
LLHANEVAWKQKTKNLAMTVAQGWQSDRLVRIDTSRMGG